MKRILFFPQMSIVLLLVFGRQECVYGQKSIKDVFFFNEFTVSCNRSIVVSESTKGGFGFGINLKRVCYSNKQVNLLIGIGYDMNKRVTKNIPFQKYINMDEGIYTTQMFAILVGVRYNVGKKIKFLMESNVSAELFFGKIKGDAIECLPTSPLPTCRYVKETIDEQYKFPFTLGIESGLGITVPVKKITLIIKTDYKLLPIRTDNGEMNQYIKLSCGIRL